MNQERFKNENNLSHIILISIVKHLPTTANSVRQ